VFESEANEYVQGNSKSTNTAGVADLSLSRVITENQWKGWRNQQIFHTTQQSDFQYSAQVQSSCMGVDQASHAPPRHGDPLFEVLKRQEELTSYLIQQQGNPRILPRREISVFDGDPLQYIAFIRAFEHGIEEKTNNEKDCIFSSSLQEENLKIWSAVVSIWPQTEAMHWPRDYYKNILAMNSRYLLLIWRKPWAGLL